MALSTHLVVRVRPPGDGLDTQLGTRSLVRPFDTGSHPDGLPPKCRYEDVTGRARSGSINPATAINEQRPQPYLLLTAQAHHEYAFWGLDHQTASETGLARTRGGSVFMMYWGSTLFGFF